MEEENIRKIVYDLSNGALTPETEEKIIAELLESGSNVDENIIKQKVIAVGNLPRVQSTEIRETKEETEKQHDYKEEVEMQKEEFPPKVMEIMRRARAGRVISFFEVRAVEAEKIRENSRINTNGGRVLMVEIADSSRTTGPNRYYGMQDGRLVLEGNEDDSVEQYVGDRNRQYNRQGKLIEPLKLQSPIIIEYKDSHFSFKTKIEDNPELSMDEINNYKKDLIETCEQYSQALEVILDDNIPNDEKVEKLQSVNDWCNKETTDLAKENDIKGNTDEMVDRAVDKNTEGLQEEVIGEDEYDERGRLIPPRTCKQRNVEI